MPASSFSSITYDGPTLVSDIAALLVSSYCATGTVSGAYREAITAGYIDQALFNQLQDLDFFGNPDATFEISIHAERIQQALGEQSIEGYQFVAFEVGMKGILVGTTASVPLVYQCPLDQSVFILTNPNNNGDVISLVGHHECRVRTTCTIREAWYVSQRNAFNQPIEMIRVSIEQLPEGRDYYEVCG